MTDEPIMLKDKPRMLSRSRKYLLNSLRIAICGGALWFVVSGVTLDDRLVLLAGGDELVGRIVDQSDPIVMILLDGSRREIAHADIAADEDGAPRWSYGVKSAWRFCRKSMLVVAALLCFPVALLQGVRLQWLLRAQGIPISYMDGIKLSFAGNFLNFATPLGSNAGDVFKAYFLTAHTDKKAEAVATIALDRIIGLGTLISTVAAITVFAESDGRLATIRPYILICFGIGVLTVFAYLSPFLRRWIVPYSLLERLPLFEQLQRMDQAARTLARRRGIVLSAVLITLALQVLAVGSYFAVAVALRLEAHAGNVLEYYAYFYTGSLVQALPGPPQGLGTVELAYRYFFSPYGSPSQIVCVAFAIRVIVLFCALPGLLVTLTGSYKPRESGSADNGVSTPRPV